MNECNVIGQRIRELREAKGLTQLELSKKMLVKRETIVQWETGVRDLKTDYTIKLADFFNTSCDYILRGIKAQNLELNKKLGLSDKAIEVLQLFNEEYRGEVIIPTVNFLLEQQTPDPYFLWGSGNYSLINDDSTEDITDECIDQTEKKLEIDHKEWVSKKYVPIIESIEKYLNVSLNNDELIDITEKGNLKRPYNGIGFKLDYDSIVKTVSKNEIIKKILLMEIEEQLQKAKEQKNQTSIGEGVEKEGHQNG